MADRTAAGRGRQPVLWMSLDMADAVDVEVCKIFGGMTGQEARNFLRSAILYYARSPLVLSANGLVDALGAADLDGRFGQVLDRIGELALMFREGLTSVGSSVRGTTGVESGLSGGGADTTPPPVFTLDSGDVSMLSALKQKFRV